MNTQADIIDAHVHLAYSDESSQSATENLLLQMDTGSVDMAVILALATEKGKIKTVSNYNDFIADTAKAFPDRFIGFGSVHPADGGKALQELDRFPDLQLKGIKLHPVLQHFNCDTKEMDLLAKKAEDLDIPILIHSYFPYDTLESQRLYQLTQNHPDTSFILAHMGGPTFLECYAYVEKRREGFHNVYFDVSSLPVMIKKSPYTEHVRWLIEQMGADRVIFGSNYPKYQLVDALSAFDDLKLLFEDSQHILGKTIAELLKL